MSYIRKGIFGAAAIMLSFGAMQFAFGEDLTVGMRTAGTPDQAIDRSGKTDRAPVLANPGAPTQTISIHVDEVPETSVLVRIPAGRDGHQVGKDQGSVPPGVANQGGGLADQGSTPANQGSAPEGNAVQPQQQVKEPRKATVACEPVVSVLTEIAKRLQPGRCIT
jgi:hypothetical protein